MTRNLDPDALAAIECDLRALLHTVSKARRPPSLLGIRRKAEAQIQTTWLNIVAATRRGIDVPSFTRAVQRGDLSGAMAAIPVDEVIEVQLRAKLLNDVSGIYDAAGMRAVATLKPKLVRKDVKFETKVSAFRFDIVHPEGLDFMRQHGAALVRSVTAEARAKLRAQLVAMLNDGVPAVAQVARIKETVGLLPAHVDAVSNLRFRLQAQAARMESRGEALGRSFSPAGIERQVASKARELHRLRALNIARTESAFAANAGQDHAWRQAADAGLIDLDTAERVWSTALDDVVRDEHAEMEGQRRKIGEPFETGDGRSVDMPPDGVNCRCALDIEP